MRNALLVPSSAVPDPTNRIMVFRTRGPVFSAGNGVQVLEARKAAGAAPGLDKLESLQLLQAFATRPVPTLAIVAHTEAAPASKRRCRCMHEEVLDGYL
jgi:hypothetical protein